MKTLIIIPAYNEELNIVNVMVKVQNFIRGKNIDYLIVNDGSKDKTLEICQNKGYKVISMAINLGLSGAFQAGMMYAYKNGYDYAMQFDADGQHDVKYIDKLQERIKYNDIVIGSRFLGRKEKFGLREMGGKVLSIAIKISSKKTITDPTSGMRMYSKKMIELFSKEINCTPEPDMIAYLISRGINVEEVSVKMDERHAGESYLTLAKALKYMIHMLVSIFVIQWIRE